MKTTEQKNAEIVTAFIEDFSKAEQITIKEMFHDENNRTEQC